jgi:GT2 family glycosyltransferase
MREDSNILPAAGIVIIGRNEGNRLIRCLKSITIQSDKLVYVDSDSTDDSVDISHNMGAEIVSLDMTVQFTAARARNEGFKRMLELYPQIKYVQFVDGDCEINSGWLGSAVNFLEQHNHIAVVSGRLRERYPEKTVYNMLCDIEWDKPVGESKACGGIALMRVSAFEGVGGFRADLIAGEEPELCVRLRAAGWIIWHLAEEMAFHDAAMVRFGQWWKRSMRGGYSFAEGAFLHGAPPERHRVRESLRSLIWGLVIPVVTLSLTICLGVWWLAILLVYPAQIVRLAWRGKRSAKTNWWHALFLVLGKFPEAMGQLNFFFNRLAGKKAHLIEYK